MNFIEIKDDVFKYAVVLFHTCCYLKLTWYISLCMQQHLPIALINMNKVYTF